MELREIIIFIVACFVSYLLGNISIARFITKKESKGDISTQGSGNPGTMNMLRTHGVFMGLFTLFCDALKGAIPALFALLYFGKVVNLEMGYISLYSFGLFAVLGHIFPVFNKFKGGKGIATTFGIFIVADPICTVIMFAIMFVTLYYIKIGSVVSLLFIIIEAVEQMFRKTMSGNWIALLIMCLIVLLDIYCHRGNIVRLIENRENPADLQEGLNKDIEKIKNKRAKKLERNSIKSGKIEQKYDKKINDKQIKIKNKIEKINAKKSGVQKNKTLVKSVKASESSAELIDTKKNNIDNDQIEK